MAFIVIALLTVYLMNTTFMYYLDIVLSMNQIFKLKLDLTSCYPKIN